jgi:hypothetical protein
MSQIKGILNQKFHEEKSQSTPSVSSSNLYMTTLCMHTNLHFCSKKNMIWKSKSIFKFHIIPAYREVLFTVTFLLGTMTIMLHHSLPRTFMVTYTFFCTMVATLHMLAEQLFQMLQRSYKIWFKRTPSSYFHFELLWKSCSIHSLLAQGKGMCKYYLSRKWVICHM